MQLRVNERIFHLLLLSLQLEVSLIELLLNFIDSVVGVLSRVLETLLSQADTDLLFTQLFFLHSSSR